MRCIDADALKEKAWDVKTQCGYVQVVDVGDIDDAPTIEPEPSIPISWIERCIDWLKDMDNGFANITAMNFEIMLRRWREEQNETD